MEGTGNALCILKKSVNQNKSVWATLQFMHWHHRNATD
jgi:hypothetical protein